MWYLFLRAGVLDLFLTADRSTLDNFTSDHPGSAVELASGGEGVVVVGSADRYFIGNALVINYLTTLHN